MSRRVKNPLASLASDFPSSVVVFLVALPLCLGIALGSNAPLFSGIIAGIAGGLVVGAFSGSQLSVSGPAAGLTAIVAVAIGKLPNFEAFLLAVVIAGIFQIALGYLKAGVLGDYVPSAVIKAMLAAIGVILILKQLPHLVGYNADFEGDETFTQPDGSNTFSGIFNSLNYILPVAILIGLFSLGIQIFWDKVLVKKARIFRLIPAPLVVVLVAVAMNQYLISTGKGLPAHSMVTIPVADSVSGFFSFFTFPDFSQCNNFSCEVIMQ